MTALLAVTGDAFARIAESGGEWTVSVALAETGARCVAVDPAEPRLVYVGTPAGVVRSQDAGASWERTVLSEDVFSLAVSPADGVVYAGCEPSMLFRSADRGLNWEELATLRELPSAPTWSFPPRPWTSHVRWIAPSPHDAERLIVGIELGGVMLSDDGGASWFDHRPGAQPDCHSLAWHPQVPGRAYEAGGGGAAWSDDGGHHWQPADRGRDRDYTWGLAVDPGDPERWYVSASTGPRAAHGGSDAQAAIYRWQGEGPWERLAGGLPEPLESMPYALLASEDRLYAGLGDGRIVASDDRGDGWSELPLGGDRLERVLALAAVE